MTNYVYMYVYMRVYVWSWCVCLCVCAGDITPQGFEKKKAKLLAPYLSSGEFLLLHILRRSLLTFSVFLIWYMNCKTGVHIW